MFSKWRKCSHAAKAYSRLPKALTLSKALSKKHSSAKNYFRESKKIESLKEKELSDFIRENIGKQIKFRYKSERAGSDKWWRCVKVHDQDDVYLYTAEYYPSGGRMRYLKERIVEYKETGGG